LMKSYLGRLNLIHPITGKWLSEALIFVSTNPQYDNRLFIESPVQYMKIPSSEHVVFTIVEIRMSASEKDLPVSNEMPVP
jgi:hypothetical protein